MAIFQTGILTLSIISMAIQERQPGSTISIVIVNVMPERPLQSADVGSLQAIALLSSLFVLHQEDWRSK
jgi:hypothetical protein